MTNEERMLITNLNDNDLIELYNKVVEHLDYLKNSLIDLDSENGAEEETDGNSNGDESKTGGDDNE